MDSNDLGFLGPKEDSSQKNKENNQTPTGEELNKYYNDLEKKIKNEKKSKQENKQKAFEKDQYSTQILKIDEYKKHPLVVLESEKNTSYMSCVLHCLGNINYIYNNYLNDLKKIKEYIFEIPLSYAFSRVIFHIYPSPKDNNLSKSFFLTNFYNATIFLNPYFRGNSSKNACSFILFLLEQLHEDYKKYKGLPNYINKIKPNTDIEKYNEYLSNYESTYILNTFGWIRQEIKRCDNCNAETIIYQHFFSLDLDIEDYLNKSQFNKQIDLSIYRCIRYQCQKSTIFNHYCKICKNKYNHEKQLLIYSFPKYLIITLGLNDSDKKNNLYKMRNKIIIDEVLVLNNFINEFSSNSNYLLEGIIYYDYENSKEYIAYFCKDFNGKEKWFEHKKNKITEIKLEKNDITIPKRIFNQKDLTPVILFYKLIEWSKSEKKKINN